MEQQVWDVLEQVMDPEIPILSVVDLGVVRYVHCEARGENPPAVRVGLTPTYSGCPATEVIRQSVYGALRQSGYENVILDEVLAPAWSSDWLSESAHQKLRAFGIAPPERTVDRPRQLLKPAAVVCPRCSSTRTERISEFGSTPCKAHYRCQACLEPFDQFKCI
jgi:ring-1,2-phenylacetyl-CoA epoxidase subunit PaaD